MYVAAPACFAADPEPEALEGEAQMDAYLARATARLAQADFDGALADANALLALAPISQPGLPRGESPARVR